MIVAAILVAAGSGERLGADVPKAFVTVAGRTLLEHAASRFTDAVRDLIVVAPSSHLEQAAKLVPSATVVAGGATRQQSVAAGLAALGRDVQAVLVHDVARAFTPVEVIRRVVDALASYPAVIPVVPVTDTIRRTGLDGVLHDTLDRSSLVAVQTPQGFHRGLLVHAHDGAPESATDDASLVEAHGVQVHGVPGDELAFKITYPLDLARAEAVCDGTP